MANAMNTTNTTNSTIPDYNFAYALYSETGKIVAYSLVYGLISIVGLIGNLMVVMVMVMNRSMHTATNVLLLNLSISDLVFILIVVPSLLEAEVCNGRWVLGETMATLAQISTNLCTGSSIFTMMAIALERYFAVVHPLKQIVRKTKWTVVTAIIIIWTCAIALSIPDGIYVVLVSRRIAVIKDGKITDERETAYFLTSSMDIEASKAVAMSLFVAFNVIPIFFLISLYSQIVWKLWNPDRQLTQELEGAPKQGRPTNFVAKARRKTTIMLIVVLAVFFICNFPYNLYKIVIAYGGLNIYDKNANSILRIFIVLNTATNPIIYNFLSEKFRVGFRNIFSCHWGQNGRVATTMDATTVLS